MNAVDPGLTATEMGGPLATSTPEETSEIVVRLATLGVLGPTGGFYRDGDLNEGMLKQPW